MQPNHEKDHSEKKENKTQEQFEDKLPKNVRQIGKLSPSVKIYMEDFTLNYIKRIRKEPGDVAEHTCMILIGEKHMTSKATCFFICGAVELKLDVRTHSGPISEEYKKQTLKTIEQYFGKEHSSLGMVGWSGLHTLSEKLPEEYEQFHRENFAANNTLFLGVNEEGEEDFYLNENGTLRKQTGYYIYFERNTGMQQYVQDYQPSQCVEMEVIPKGKSESYRMMLKNRKQDVQQKNLVTFLYLASTFLVMVVVVLGITLMNHYDKLKSMQDVITSLSKSVVSGQAQVSEPYRDSKETVADAATKPAVTIEPSEAHDKAVTGPAVADLPSESTDQEKQAEDEKDSQTMGNKENMQQYTIQPGDTLISISRKVYHTTAMVDEICKYNNIQNSDSITAGDQIWLP